jgi:hypothetical protein
LKIGEFRHRTVEFIFHVQQGFSHIVAMPAGLPDEILERWDNSAAWLMYASLVISIPFLVELSV